MSYATATPFILCHAFHAMHRGLRRQSKAIVFGARFFGFLQRLQEVVETIKSNLLLGILSLLRPPGGNLLQPLVECAPSVASPQGRSPSAAMVH